MKGVLERVHLSSSQCHISYTSRKSCAFVLRKCGQRRLQTPSLSLGLTDTWRYCSVTGLFRNDKFFLAQATPEDAIMSSTECTLSLSRTIQDNEMEIPGCSAVFSSQLSCSIHFGCNGSALTFVFCNSQEV